MAKIYGLFGSMTGKLADTVMSVRNGEQIARKYQPVVYNPSTPAQVASRAKLKLMSQLSAVMAPVIAIRREGSISSRNQFVKKNYPLTTYAGDTASVNLEGVQLTNSVVGLGGIRATRGETTTTLEVFDDNVDRVVYATFVKNPDGTMRLAGSGVIASGVGGTFTAELTLVAAREYVIYAYGVRDNTNAARVMFGDMEVETAVQMAELVTSRTLLESDVTLTETLAATIPVANA